VLDDATFTVGKLGNLGDKHLGHSSFSRTQSIASAAL
jgi:hypothetical protein